MATLTDALSRCRFDDAVPERTRQRAIRLIDAWALPELEGALHLHPLAGGANNINVVIDGERGRWVLKLRAAKAAMFNAGFDEAVAGQQIAASVGVAPRVLAHSPDGDFLSEFVECVTLRPDVIRKERCSPAMVEALHKLHRAPTLPRRFELFADTRVFTQEARQLGANFDDKFLAIWREAERLDVALRAAQPPMAFIHGDLVPQNFILAKDGVKFVDFDYCGTGMVAADLAIAACQAEMDAAETEAFLRLYDPALDEGQRARIHAIQFINTLREISWATLASLKVSDRTVLFQDWSYEGHIAVNVELANRLMASPDFQLLALRVQQVRTDALF